MSTHIKNTTSEQTWCGDPLGADFYFKDIEAAAANGQFGDRPVCALCVTKIINCLVIKIGESPFYAGT